MTAREIVPGVFSVGVIDWDRRIFDELIPLPYVPPTTVTWCRAARQRRLSIPSTLR
ncbi:MAG: hypothetical protein RQM90_12890 [Methanoculleus sp.]